MSWRKNKISGGTDYRIETFDGFRVELFRTNVDKWAWFVWHQSDPVKIQRSGICRLKSDAYDAAMDCFEYWPPNYGLGEKHGRLHLVGGIMEE